MSAGAWFVWSPGRTGGAFPTEHAALDHCRVIANDHRRHVELQTFSPSAFLYLGPRGRRHGRRLVAVIATRVGLDEIGIRPAALEAAIAAAS